MSRKPYPSDVSGEEWAFCHRGRLCINKRSGGCAPEYLSGLSLVCARVLRVAVGREAGPSAAVFDSLYPDKHILDS